MRLHKVSGDMKSRPLLEGGEHGLVGYTEKKSEIWLRSPPAGAIKVVPTPGIEPGRPHGQRILSPQRLPVPPRGHIVKDHPDLVLLPDFRYPCQSLKV